ncbi:MAG TPA: hypothetical protein VGF75_05785 [Candidatus Saccharimonadales bacterium]|jgi:hypothetical protein
MNEQLSTQEAQVSPEQVLQAGSEFLQHFGVEVSPAEQPDQFMEAMKQLDPRYEGGRELVRYELAEDQREWPEDTKQVIMRGAENMGMLKPETPLVGDIDVVIALGGANQQNHERPRYALEAMKKGEATFKQLVIAGSSRKLKEAEQKNTANYAPGAETEFDLCVAGAAMLAKEYPGVPISVLFVDDEKAGTPDVIESVLAAEQANGTLKPDSRVAAVTTQIYQESTELDLARVSKKFGIAETQTAGIPSPAKTIEGRTPATYKSEIIRTLKAATNGAVAEKAAKVAHAENVAQVVSQAIRPEEEVLHVGDDGSHSVQDQEGNIWVVEPDGTRWQSYSASSGLSYNSGSSSDPGYYAE